MNRPIGLAALTVLELPPPEQVTCAAEAGYRHVGLRLLPATPEEVQHPMVGDTPMVRETAQRLTSTGVRVIDIEIFRLTPATRVDDYRAALETGAHLGASEALVAGNDPDVSRLVDNFAKFCHIAREYGIGGNLEPMPWTDVRNFAEASRIVGLVDCGNAGVLVDPIHFDRGGSRPEEITSVPPTWLRYVQLCDAPARRPSDVATLLHQARAERLMPGDGDLDLIGMLRAVPAHIPISIEIPMQELARTVPAVERARRMLAKTHALLAAVDSIHSETATHALSRTT